MSNRVRYLVRFVRNRSCGVRKDELSNEGQHFARFVRNRSCGVRKCKNAHLSMRVFRCLCPPPRRAAFATRPRLFFLRPFTAPQNKRRRAVRLFPAPTHQQNKKTARRAPLYRSAKQKTARRAARRSRIIKSKDMFTSSRSSNRCTACRKTAP